VRWDGDGVDAFGEEEDVAPGPRLRTCPPLGAVQIDHLHPCTVE
jgi:hypothetical protein